MTKLLHVNASARGEHSQSLAIARAFVEALADRRPDLEVDTLDLFSADLPEFGTVAADAKMAVFGGQEQTAEQKAAWDAARAVFDRFAAADVYVFNVPMWNAGVPYVLKQWIDIVTQPGWAFGFDPATGYEGLLTGKRALAVYTSGVYAPGVPLEFGADFATTFFDDWLRFVGITDTEVVRFAPTVLTGAPDEDLAGHVAHAQKLAANF
ncbi:MULTISPECIES: FMN-dependent NADH-azoreductase [Rhodococcus]|jgi:FMN-dependent NADH-azoreductase|uniref:FMN dependent NADH:quinone oxidoreductase n=1 Tax=Rhodococcus aetherivorans TaxID=191292 RepID=A0A059MGZ8_9NOCA|nr:MULTISPECIES: NAD(P)H-dependent oxidoreductase [Rhodococcus]ETT24463.1 FMN-dependent NADH-azoreductase [Rhodococcus rhodochrous ATCC 21198]NCL73237.1 FMN-dependent NADH-azoreductase [Rhodococcus sp. YH1]AKE88108.1 FMN-dependent NADH-azoreductase [Rhodococcus aetherivorans]ANZ27280.1 FMN-dependent NADH-azoreductase [Rhodococcus sp. WB1]KDE10460.1 FMN-dependent NADH-azoreductase [Rhodococcus aetherivorans]